MILENLEIILIMAALLFLLFLQFLPARNEVARRIDFAMNLILIIGLIGYLGYDAYKSFQEDEGISTFLYNDGRVQELPLAYVWAPEQGASVFIPSLGFSPIQTIRGDEAFLILRSPLTDLDRESLVGTAVLSRDLKHKVGIVAQINEEESLVRIKLH